MVVDPVRKFLSALFTAYIHHRRTPDDAPTVIIYKKADPDILSNYRPIALGCTAAKLYAICSAGPPPPRHLPNNAPPSSIGRSAERHRAPVLVTAAADQTWACCLPDHSGLGPAAWMPGPRTPAASRSQGPPGAGPHRRRLLGDPGDDMRHRRRALRHPLPPGVTGLALPPPPWPRTRLIRRRHPRHLHRWRDRPLVRAVDHRRRLRWTPRRHPLHDDPARAPRL
ncbi:hypothetical protein HPB52_023187 [Rhipicephalus sanguineus]|uniref:Uncharacterized protein n=1 Tax=Rhipicephalus sanguineus TaxID=34632 RepID=A0A9D4T6J3_RHISA|nr:hypothetical protein HPB52_023187 [Rhipicephalus sanguineus]